MAPQPNSQSVCVCVCIYAAKRERERGRERARACYLPGEWASHYYSYCHSRHETTLSPHEKRKKLQQGNNNETRANRAPLQRRCTPTARGALRSNPARKKTTWQINARASRQRPASFKFEGKNKNTAKESCVWICCQVFFKRPSGRR